jgi:membrane protein YdbS with pleckstrin-like domain
MPKLDRYLLRSEDQVFSVRRHWVSLASAGGRLALFWIAGLLVLWLVNDVAALRALLVTYLLVTLGWFAWVVSDWYVERFVVTNKRVLLVTGILTRKVAIMPLIKVTDLTYEQTLLGRVLDYGSFVIESAGQEQALSRVDYLPDPNLRYHQVSELLFGRYAMQTQDDGTGSLWPDGPPGLPAPAGPAGPPPPPRASGPRPSDRAAEHPTSPLPRIPPPSDPRPFD